MTSIRIPPPTIDELLSYMAEWVARNTSSKVTITVYVDEHCNFTEEYDARFLNNQPPTK